MKRKDLITYTVVWNDKKYFYWRNREFFYSDDPDIRHFFVCKNLTSERKIKREYYKHNRKLVGDHFRMFRKVENMREFVNKKFCK